MQRAGALMHRCHHLPTIGSAARFCVDATLIETHAIAAGTAARDRDAEVGHASARTGGAVEQVSGNTDLAGSDRLDLHDPALACASEKMAVVVAFDLDHGMGEGARDALGVCGGVDD